MKKTDVAKKMKASEHTPPPIASQKSIRDRNYAFEKRAFGIKKRNQEYRESQKGAGALNIPKSKTGKNEGNNMYEGKNEQERM